MINPLTSTLTNAKVVDRSDGGPERLKALVEGRALVATGSTITVPDPVEADAERRAHALGRSRVAAEYGSALEAQPPDPGPSGTHRERESGRECVSLFAVAVAKRRSVSAGRLLAVC